MATSAGSPFRTRLTVLRVSAAGVSTDDSTHDFQTECDRRDFLTHVIDQHCDAESGDSVQWERDSGYYGFGALIANAHGGDHTLISAFPAPSPTH